MMQSVLADWSLVASSLRGVLSRPLRPLRPLELSHRRVWVALHGLPGLLLVV